MTKRLVTSLFMALALTVVPVAFTSSIALARNGVETDNATERDLESSKERERLAEDRRVAIEDRKERFEANKLRVCEKRQEQIKNMIKKVSLRGTKQLDVFKKIADKTKQFYISKGYNDAGYQALTDEVEALYTTASEAVNSTSSAGSSWSCSGDNPKQTMADFRDAKKNEIAQLKAYKDKVRELILLVKKAGGGDASTDANEETR